MSILLSIKNLTSFEKNLWFVSLLVVFSSFIFLNSPDTIIMIASLVGVTALTFVAKGDALGQVLTVIFSILYAIISFQFRYYGEMITYLGMTMPIAFLSIVFWLKNPYSKKEVKIETLNTSKWIILIITSLIVTAVFYFILVYFNTNNILFSTISITTSFFAASLMMLRSPYYAIAYALNDIVLITLWVLATMENILYLPMVICFFIFLINDTYGFINWRKMEKNQKIN